MIKCRGGFLQTLMILRIDRNLWTLFLLATVAVITAAHAVESPADCETIDADAERLACYNRAVNSSSAAQKMAVPDKDTAAIATGESYLWKTWELEQGNVGHTFHLLPYGTTYFLPIRYSDNVNTTPSSPASNHTAASALPLESIEAKFQFSLKFKIWEKPFGESGNLWLAYTQQSYWQMYSGSQSSPFRETDYEPEAIIAFRTNIDVLGLHWRIFNLGFIHQSNGREDPYSRSWNRLYGQFGLERGKFSLLIRPWLRLPEDAETDDNPDIGNYFGNGDVRAMYRSGGHIYSLLGRYNLSSRRGALQFNGEFPISGPLKGYLQLFSGYGESLIDYNHYQNVVGIGLLLIPWQ